MSSKDHTWITPHRRLDLTGTVVRGKLAEFKVIGRAPDDGSRYRRTRWVCRCVKCGSEKTYKTIDIGRDRIACKACKGPTRSSLTGDELYLYRVWCGIRNRCRNGTRHARYYADRGITLCEEWERSFESFRDWALQNDYKHGLTVDRINNDKGYSPDNCRLADRALQLRNRRPHFTLFGVDDEKLRKELILRAEALLVEYGLRSKS